jgi:hypothetical protein
MKKRNVVELKGESGISDGYDAEAGKGLWFYCCHHSFFSRAPYQPQTLSTTTIPQMETKIHEPFFSEADLAKLPRWAQNRIKQMQASIDRHREEESQHKALVQMKTEWETARRKFIERNPTRVYGR